jgi:hypothetical protein
MSLTLAQAAPILKEYYTAQRVENMTYKDFPLFGMLPKDKNFYGKVLPLPIQIGNPQGRSATFATAQANKTSSVYKSFLLTRVRDYALASVDNETAEASENEKGAFIKTLTREIDSAIQAATTSLAWALYGDGSGSIGQISATSFNTANTFFLLSNADDVVKFEIGQHIVFAAAASTGNLRVGGSLLISGVNRATGRIDVTAALSTITAIASGDYIFTEGDRNAKLSGLAAWIPYTSPVGGDSFFGVDRSVDATRLSGVKYDGSALSIEEALIGGLTLCNREGGKPAVAMMNYINWGDLEKALGSKVSYMISNAAGRADIGFEGIQVKTNKGVCNVIADPFCPINYCYGLTMSSWTLFSLKEPVRILDLDGNKILRETAADAVELRVGGYFQLGCTAPGHNVVIKLA